MKLIPNLGRDPNLAQRSHKRPSHPQITPAIWPCFLGTKAFQSINRRSTQKIFVNFRSVGRKNVMNTFITQELVNVFRT